MAMVTIDKRRSGSAHRLPEVAADGRISADDVLRLRRAIYQNGGIDRDKAEALFRLNRDHKRRDPAWAEFYVEALSDFFHWREGSDSALTEEAERMLADWIGPADRIDPEAVETALLDGVRSHGLELLPWSDAARGLRRRAAFARFIDPGIADLGNEALLESLPAAHTKPGQALRTIPGLPPDLAQEFAGCPFAPRCSYVQDECRTAAVTLESIGPGRATACLRVQRGELE